jgi:hypothetical protein
MVSSPEDRGSLFRFYWGRDVNVYRNLIGREPRRSKVLGGLRVDGIRKNSVKRLIGIESGLIGFVGESIC